MIGRWDAAPARRVGRRSAVAAALLAVVLAGGCAPLSAVPGGAAPGTRSSTPANERPSPPVVEQALAGAATPTLAVAAFAVGYINWTARTVSGRMRGLAALSVGQARSLVTLTAA